MEIKNVQPPQTASGMKIANAPPAQSGEKDSFTQAPETQGGILHRMGEAIKHALHPEHKAKEPGAWYPRPDGSGSDWYTESSPPPPRDAHGKWIIDTACGACDWYWAKEPQPADGPECGLDHRPSKPEEAGSSQPTAPSQGPSLTPQVKWTKALSVNGSPLLGPGGKLYVSTSYPDQALHAFDPATGSEYWKQSYYGGGRGPQAPVKAGDGSLVVAGDDGALHGVDPATGRDLWNLPESVGSSITAYDDGRLSFVSGGQLKCVDARTRKEVSSTPLGHRSFESAPVRGKDGTVYGGGHDGYVYALEEGTGKEKWKFKTGALIRNSPTVGPDGTVYVASIDKTLHALNPETGEQKWSLPTNHWVTESPTLGKDGTVFFGNSDNYVFAVDPKTGQEKWQFYCGAEIRVPPLPAEDGRLYVVTDRNQVLGLDQASGAKEWTYSADSYIHCQPAVDDKGNFYFGCNNGRLYAVSTRPEEPQAKAEGDFLLTK